MNEDRTYSLLSEHLLTCITLGFYCDCCSCLPGFSGSYCQISETVTAASNPVSSQQALLISFSTFLPVAGLVVIVIAAYYVWASMRAVPDLVTASNIAQGTAANRSV
jgi:hypothetical protein